MCDPAPSSPILWTVSQKVAVPSGDCPCTGLAWLEAGARLPHREAGPGSHCSAHLGHILQQVPSEAKLTFSSVCLILLRLIGFRTGRGGGTTSPSLQTPA